MPTRRRGPIGDDSPSYGPNGEAFMRNALRISSSPHTHQDDKSSKPPPESPNFVIKVDQYQWNVHKDTLFQKSDFFKGMLSSEYRESCNSVLDLSDEDPEIVARIVLWCYFDSYPVGELDYVSSTAKSIIEITKEGWTGKTADYKEPSYNKGTAMLHLEILILADFLMIPDLKDYAFQKLCIATEYCNRRDTRSCQTSGR